MKEIVITSGRLRKEIIIFCLCMVMAIVLNIYSILEYQTKWSELWTQFFWTLSIAVFIYVLSIIFRIFIYGIKRLFMRIRHR